MESNASGARTQTKLQKFISKINETSWGKENQINIV